MKFANSNLAMASIIGGIALGTIAMLATVPEFAVSRVSFVRSCTGKDAGTWNWGEAPSGCDASKFGNVSRIRFVYSDFVFDRTKATDEEHRRDYVTNIHALLRDLSSQYIRARQPDVKDDEVAAFNLAIEAVAHQETYWSHYRIGADSGYKLMTGDKNISHGMMQINQRYHASKEADNSFDLVGNVGFGIEHFYQKWEMASKARCINRARNQTRDVTLQNITRAAYSAYNGGSDAICRWTNPRHAWAKNDKNYFAKLKGQAWSEWVRSEDGKIKIDLDCVRSGDELCAVAKDRMGEYLSSRPLLMENGTTCVMTGARKLDCARDLRVFSCMTSISPDVADAAPLKVKDSDGDVAKMTRTVHEDRIALCKSNHPGLALVGDTLTMKQDVALRADIGSGKTLGFAKKGQSYQVLDMEIDLDGKKDRYYRVRLPNKAEGWMKAGDEMSAEKFATVSNRDFAPADKSVTAWLPAKGGKIEIVKADGIKVLVQPESPSAPATPIETKGILEKGTVVDVEEVKVLGAANEIWLRIKQGSEVGYVFAGRTFPQSTIDQWVKVK